MSGAASDEPRDERQNCSKSRAIENFMVVLRTLSQRRMGLQGAEVDSVALHAVGFFVLRYIEY